MDTLLLKNIRTLVNSEIARRVYENVNLFCKNGRIVSIGPEAPEADEVMDASHMLCYPRPNQRPPSPVSGFFPKSAAGAKSGAVRLAGRPV